MGRTRYKVDSVLNNLFYQMPKFLFNQEFEGISNDARVLYTLLKDRHELSIQNQWIDKYGDVYLIYTREDMALMLNCSQPSIRKYIKELTEYELMEEERIGMNRANRIYLSEITSDLYSKQPVGKECKNVSVQSPSGVKNSFSQECKIFSPIKNDSNNYLEEEEDLSQKLESLQEKQAANINFATEPENKKEIAINLDLEKIINISSALPDSKFLKRQITSLFYNGFREYPLQLVQESVLIINQDILFKSISIFKKFADSKENKSMYYKVVLMDCIDAYYTPKLEKTVERKPSKKTNASSNKSKIPQANNYPQRQYDDEYYESLYDTPWKKRVDQTQEENQN